MTFHDIDSLLELYGIHVVRRDDIFKTLMLAVAGSSSILYMEDDDNDIYSSRSFGFRSPDGIVKALCSMIRAFITYDSQNVLNRADNIYFGCKSLDEMLVKQDLHAGADLWQLVP